MVEGSRFLHYGRNDGNKLGLGSSNVGECLRATLGGFAVLFGFFAGSTSLFSFVFLDTTELVDEAHFTCKEWVAFGADINRNGVAGRTCLERIAAAAGNRYWIVFGMDVGFHGGNYSRVFIFCEARSGIHRK